MNHPCNDWKCPEYNHGQCFGMGCSTNPMPAPSEPTEHYLYDDSVPFAEDDETENTQED